MQTRRDQLHAYRFQNRRALAALVTGEPNVVEPPMRRLTVTTISGIMIAILVAVGFALYGLIKPSSGDEWRDAGVVIVENETGARYVLLNNVLHPALNFSSAVLAAASNQKIKIVHVDRGDLDGTDRGATIGIPGLPDSLPGSSSLITAPWTVCSRQQEAESDQLQARVTVSVGSTAGARPLPATAATVVRGLAGSTQYLLYRGRRLEISSDRVATSLGLTNAAVLDVGTAFVNSVPPGPKLQAPDVPGAGNPAPDVNGRPALVGQLLHVTDNDTFFVLLRDGDAALNPVQTALLRTLPIGPGHTALKPLDITEDVALGIKPSKSDWNKIVLPQLAGLPSSAPRVTDAAKTNGGICSIYRKNSTIPELGVPPSKLPTFTPGGVRESGRSSRGLADDVVLRPGTAALVKADDTASTVFVVADPGEKFAAASTAALSGFGYASSTPAKLPDELLPLIPTGPALDPGAARRPVPG